MPVVANAATVAVFPARVSAPVLNSSLYVGRRTCAASLLVTFKLEANVESTVGLLAHGGKMYVLVRVPTQCSRFRFVRRTRGAHSASLTRSGGVVCRAVMFDAGCGCSCRPQTTRARCWRAWMASRPAGRPTLCKASRLRWYVDALPPVPHALRLPWLPL